MAEDTPLGATTTDSSFDRWLKADEAANLDPILNPQPAPAAADATKVPGSPEAPPVPEAPPAPEAVAAEPEAADGKSAVPEAPVPASPPVEAAAETEEPEPLAGETPEQKAKRRPSWKDVRELQNEIKQERALRLQSEQSRDARDGRVAELEMEIARMRGMIEGRAPAPEAEVIEPDPLTKVEREIEQLKQMDQVRAQEQMRAQVDMTIRNHEAEFERRPEGKNYRAALDHLVKSEIAEWAAIGALDQMAGDIRRQNPAEVRQYAIQTGKNEVDAARDLATRSALMARRDGLVAASLRAGKNVAEVVWTMAQQRGFRPAAETPPPAAPVEKPIVRDAKAIKEASQSLSAMPTTKPPPPKHAPRTRDELLDMDVDERARFIEEMDATKGPDWLKDMR